MSRFVPKINKLYQKPTTIMLCHKGTNYNVLKTLAKQGINISLIEPYPTKKSETKSFKIAQEICDIMKRHCVTVLQCNINNTHHVKYAMNETIDIYGSIEGIVLYEKYKWDYSCFLYSYMKYARVGQITIIDHETNTIQNDEHFH
jgi:hypothetical protein